MSFTTRLPTVISFSRVIRVILTFNTRTGGSFLKSALVNRKRNKKKSSVRRVTVINNNFTMDGGKPFNAHYHAVLPSTLSTGNKY